MAILVDANLFIRYFLNDDEKKARKTEILLKSDKDLWLNDVVISEIIWLLTSYFKFSKQEIIPKIETLLTLPNIKANKNVLFSALFYYKKYTIDWIDAYLASIAISNQFKIASYDRDFDKINEIVRIEP